jgi:HEAT repeat protein
MVRPWLIVPVLLLMVPCVRGAEDDPEVYGRKLSVWQEALSSGKRHPVIAEVVGCVVGPAPSRAITAKLAKFRQAAVLALELAGAPSRKSLAAAIIALRDDPEEEVRVSAVVLLGQWGAKRKEDTSFQFAEGRDAMFLAMKDSAPAVRRAAAAAVGDLVREDGKQAVTTLILLLKDKDTGVRLAAAETLRRLDKDAVDAVPALTEVVKDRDAPPLLRMQTALALGRIGDDALPALAALKEVIADAKAPLEVRKAVAETLGRFGRGAAEAAPQLAVALTPTEPTELRRAAMTALDKLGPFAQKAVKDIKKAMRDEDRFVRCLAMHCLGQMGADLDKSDARDIVAVLLEALADGSLEVRVAAIDTLGTLGRDVVGDDAAQVEKRLKDLSKDTRDAIRDAANAALKRFGEK